MSPVSVVTDSTSYLPPELVERNGIAVVPLYVVFGGDRTVPEIDITDYPAFFEELRTAEKLPTTSQPSVGRLHRRLRAAARRTAARSSPCTSPAGCRARPRRRARRRRRSRATAGAASGSRWWTPPPRRAASGFMVLAAAKAARDGASAPEVAAHVAEARKELRLWFAIDTLEFLRRGGRIGAASAWIGSTLEGEADPHRRERDDAGRARAHLVARVRAAGGVRAGVRATRAPTRGRPSTSTRPTSAPRLVERCPEIYGHGPTIVSEIGPVLSAHTGPGLLGTGARAQQLRGANRSRSRAGRARIPP